MWEPENYFWCPQKKSDIVVSSCGHRDRTAQIKGCWSSLVSQGRHFTKNSRFSGTSCVVDEWEWSHRLIYLRDWYQLVNCFRQIRKCYLVEDMSLMVAFKVWKNHSRPCVNLNPPPSLSSFSSLWIEYNLSATDLVLYLFAGHHISHHEDHGLTLWNYKQTPKSMLYLPWSWYIIDNNKKVTKKMSACNSRDKIQDKWLLKNFLTARVDKPLNSRFSEELYLKYK